MRQCPAWCLKSGHPETATTKQGFMQEDMDAVLGPAHFEMKALEPILPAERNLRSLACKESIEADALGTGLNLMLA